MVVTKILETTLAIGETTVQFTDSDIPNSMIRVYCNDPDLIYDTISITGSTITATYPAQNVVKYIALELVKSGLTIVDNLTTDDATKALSAKQGKALDDKIDTLDLEDLYNVSVTTPSNGEILNYYEGEWINVPAKDKISDLDDVEITSITGGQILAWDADNDKFVNVTPSTTFLAPDFSNQIYDSGNITSGYSTYEYTALYDCWLGATIRGEGLGTTAIIYVNGVSVLGSDNNKNITFSPFFIKAGDVITVRNVSNSLYRIFLYGSR